MPFGEKLNGIFYGCAGSGNRKSAAAIKQLQ